MPTGRFLNYFRETKTELRQVTWLNRRQIINYTLIVVALTLAVAVYLGLADAVFQFLLKLIKS